MTAPGLRLVEMAGGTVLVYSGLVLIGRAFPKVVSRPEGVWYGKRQGVDAKTFPDRDEALAYVAGACRDSE